MTAISIIIVSSCVSMVSPSVLKLRLVGIHKYAMRIITKLFARTNKILHKSQGFAGGGVKIGKHVLIGNNCFIYKDVVIADGCVVASNSVVKNSLLEPNTLYAGVPAKAICKIEKWT